MIWPHNATWKSDNTILVHLDTLQLLSPHLSTQDLIACNQYISNLLMIQVGLYPPKNGRVISFVISRIERGLENQFILTQWLLPPTNRCPLPATVRLMSSTGVKGLPPTSYCHRMHYVYTCTCAHSFPGLPELAIREAWERRYIV